MKQRRQTIAAIRLGAVAMACAMVWSPLRADDSIDANPDRIYQRELLRKGDGTGSVTPPAAKSHATPAPRAATTRAPVPLQPSPQPPDMSTSMVLDLRQVSVNTALRLISETAQANIVATQAAGERELSLYMAQTTAGQALDAVARAAGLWVRWRPSSRTWMVMTAAEYQRELTVFGEERTEVLHLKHHNVVAVASTLRAMFGERVVLQNPVEEALGETMKVTDLRRSSGSSGNSNNRNQQDERRQSTSAGAAGAVQTQRGGSNRSANQDDGSQQVAAAAATARATPGQTEAAMRGEEAPLYVTYNRQHNLLVLRTGDDKVMAQARQLAGQLDLPARQVLLEMRIIQVRLGDEFHRAFDMDLFSDHQASGTATTATAQAINPLTGAATGPRTVGALGVADAFGRNTSLFQFLNNRIRVRLQLLEEKGQVQTLARPLLLASNNEPARLFIGEEVVLVTGASAQTTTGTTGATNTIITAETEQRDIGTTLVVHPRINADRTVTLTIDQESSERVVGGTTIPLATGTVGDGVVQYPIDTVNTSSVQAVAQAKDGLTIAVGGMIKINKTNKTANVPGLSKIPLLGELFKRDEQVDERTELVLIITPHVIESSEEAERLTQRMGGTAMNSDALRINSDPAQDPRRDAGLFARLALEGLGEANPAWEMDPNVRREAVQPWADAASTIPGVRSSLRGAWRWGGMTAMALELTHDKPSVLNNLTSTSLAGPWLAVALEKAPRSSEEGVFTRRVVLVTQESWQAASRKLKP